MFQFIDRFIEKHLKNWLHNKRNNIIKNYETEFTKSYPDLDVEELRPELEIEIDRAYAIVDRSILRARLSRGKYTFWITAGSSVLMVGVITGFTSGAIFPFITPPVAAFVSWAITIATIPIDYVERLHGALDWAVAKFNLSISEKKTHDSVPSSTHIFKKLDITTHTSQFMKSAAEPLIAQDDKEISVSINQLEFGQTTIPIVNEPAREPISVKLSTTG